jgi:hypothetical protein
MEVAIAYAEDIGFYLIDQFFNIVSPMIFPDYDSVLDYCDKYEYIVVNGDDNV